MRISKTVIAFVSVCLVWTFSWIILKHQAVIIVDNSCSIFYRLFLGSLVCFAIARKYKYNLAIPLRYYQYPVISAITNVFANLYFVYKASYYMPSGMVAAIGCIAVITNEIFAALMRRQKISFNILLCGLIAVIGVILFILPTIKNSPNGSDISVGVMFAFIEVLVICPGFYATKTFFNKANNVPYVVYTAHILLIGSFIAFFNILNVAQPVYFDFSFTYLFSVLYSAVFASAVGYLCMAYLIHKIGEGKASYTIIVYTVGAILVSTIFEDYDWGFINLLGFVMIIFAVYSRFSSQRYMDILLLKLSKISTYIHKITQKKENIVIFGTGVIGGSIARRLMSYYRIYGISFDAKRHYFTDTALPNSKKAKHFVNKYNTIIIAAPLEAYEEIFSYLSKIDTTNKLIIECGSVKEYPLSLAQKYNLNVQFTHPITGRESTGFSYSSSHLFENKTIIYSSDNKRNEAAMYILRHLGFSGKFFLSSAEHDKIYAKVSHFVQLIAFLLHDLIEHCELIDMHNLNLQSSNYSSFARLYSSNPSIWKRKYGIFALNYTNIDDIYRQFCTFLKNAEIVQFGDVIKAVQSFIKLNFEEILQYSGTAMDNLLQVEELSYNSEINKDVVMSFFNNFSLDKYAE